MARRRRASCSDERRISASKAAGLLERIHHGNPSSTRCWPLSRLSAAAEALLAAVYDVARSSVRAFAAFAGVFK